ncbi:MAG: hypothetical protein R3200_08405, partial [Xanthomonadales bacterium]|nr:hypothetical protein [Xanthomonadales bacterium]
HAETSISNVSFAGGVFEFDLDLTNTHPNNDYLPLVEFKIVKIASSSGTVEVINADNGGDGTHPQNAALFDYSDQLGSDSVFSVGETTGTRHLQFADPAAELFTFKARVTAYTGDAAATNGEPAAAGSESGSAGDDPDTLTQLLEFTVNPLTGSVIVELVEDIL